MGQKVFNEIDYILYNYDEYLFGSNQGLDPRTRLWGCGAGNKAWVVMG